ncbi:hypothetical protein D9V28_06060 [Mycetocola zhadangensis]|uniref:Uncharacterized protein n=1 Tax=Mycetocola zhadangensis TaxID=1164595 RepID=A0A3L7J757_9MICO|nr:hypothetical protein D9V28_06060 [Mycetocola zhadangensis]
MIRSPHGSSSRGVSERVPTGELWVAPGRCWLVSTVYHREARAFFREVFYRSTVDGWERLDSYAATDPESVRRWARTFANADRDERDLSELPALPLPSPPHNLQNFPRYRTPTSASRTAATRFLPAWLALRLVGASIRRSQRRRARAFARTASPVGR